MTDVNIPVLIFALGVVIGAAAFIIKGAKNNYVLPWNRKVDKDPNGGGSGEKLNKKRVK